MGRSYVRLVWETPDISPSMPVPLTDKIIPTSFPVILFEENLVMSNKHNRVLLSPAGVWV